MKRPVSRPLIIMAQILLCLFISVDSFSQQKESGGAGPYHDRDKKSLTRDQKKKLKEYKKHPVWVDMLKDQSHLNYYETVTAFETFWEERPKPKEKELEKGKKGKKEKKRSLPKRLLKSDKKLKRESNRLVVEWKSFESWRREVQPFVQPDGTILSEERMLQIINSQVQE
ncbi:MAG: hypothetical protein J7604_24180 [Sporocytophaga sp.]|uniref:hypothetical protein n=1 Tax=Sporocytophaga sp. TaxID=2231183 RepID=UPI001B02EC53|nr:hypothetical protein [Sporocytophaga sp.]MBO9703334.1 hypothetical protein [Sporocytophaga sp.]